MLRNTSTKCDQKCNYTIAGPVNPENQFNLEKEGPCTSKFYCDAEYKRSKKTKVKVNERVFLVGWKYEENENKKIFSQWIVGEAVL